MKYSRVIAGILLLVSSLFFSTRAQAAVPIVQDYAGFLSDQNRQELEDYGQRLQEATGAELAILTEEQLVGASVEEYVTEKIRAYQLGDAKKHNGALLYLTAKPGDSGQREFFVGVGYGLEGALPDGKIGRLIDEIAMPYLQEGDAEQAIVEMYKHLYNEIAIESGYEDGVLPTEDQASDDQESFGGNAFIILLVILFILFTISSNKKGPPRGGGPRGRKRSSGGYYGGFGGFGGGSSGGFGGGSSSGGGFGGFGGGGSSGGGGAGRGW